LKREHRGQALAEFALLVPVLLGLMLGGMDLARAFHTQIALSSAARTGLLYGMQATTPAGTQLQVQDVISATVQEAAGELNLTPADVTVCLDASCFTSPSSQPIAFNQAMTVTVQTQFKPLTRFVWLWKDSDGVTRLHGTAHGRTFAG
jgi:Flp pilus assembly protein TadG